MEEQWKEIQNHKKYMVSNLGRFLNKESGKVYEGKPDKKGYKRVCLSEDGKRFLLFTHREVAKAFLPKIDGKQYINHKDGDKGNNELNNLEWCTPKENSVHAFKCLGVKAKNKRPVMCIETGIVYDSCLNASKAVNGFNSAIVRCCRGEKRHYKGYSWKYV